MDLLEKIQQYWNGRHQGYSKVNQKELEGVQRNRWKHELQQLILKDKDCRILDVGTGPGFFPIILSEMGYQQITAVDYSPEMLVSAQENAQRYLGNASMIEWRQMDAQQLSFEEASFDVVLTRNLTWNLEHPEKAYGEWLRVLKPGGQLFVFDANWYAYLSDEAVQKDFLEKRQQARDEALEDYWDGEGVDEAAMDVIVRELPLTIANRPAWDVAYLEENFPVSIHVIEDFGNRVWDREEMLNYSATPMFLIAVTKENENE